MAAATMPAKAPQAGTPAIRKENNVPHNFLGVFDAKIMLPAGADTA